MSERKRREFLLTWRCVEGRWQYVADEEPDRIVSAEIHAMEVRPGDPDPEWVDELIEYAAGVVRNGDMDSLFGVLLTNHIAKRGKQ